MEIWLRADSGFARDELMSWCEENRVEYVFGLSRNKRLEPMLAEALGEAKAGFEATRKATRIFKELVYSTLDSWSRERRVVALYYYGEATMKQIGAEIGVNESRVSQLHARAIQRLKKALGADSASADAAEALRPAILAFQQTMRRMKMAKTDRTDRRAVVLPYKMPVMPMPQARRRVAEPRLAAAR